MQPNKVLERRMKNELQVYNSTSLVSQLSEFAGSLNSIQLIEILSISRPRHCFSISRKSVSFYQHEERPRSARTQGPNPQMTRRISQENKNRPILIHIHNSLLSNLIFPHTYPISPRK